MTKDSQFEITNLQIANLQIVSFQIVSFQIVFKIEAKMLSDCFV
jgi:hypothetical protein